MIQTSNMSDAWMPNAFEILLMGGTTPTTFTLAQDSTTGAYPTIIPGMLMVLNSDGTVSPATAEGTYLGYAYQYCNYNGFSQVDESGSITVVIPGAASIFKFSGPILGSSLPTIGSNLTFDATSDLIETTGKLVTNEQVIGSEEGSLTVVTGSLGRIMRPTTDGTTTAVAMPKSKSSAAKSA